MGGSFIGTLKNNEHKHIRRLASAPSKRFQTVDRSALCIDDSEIDSNEWKDTMAWWRYNQIPKLTQM